VITICDTGPLVAYLNRKDPYHAWAVALMKQVRPPMLTCEAVLTEAAYFLREDHAEIDPLFRLIERGALRLEFELSAYWPRVRTLMTRWEQMDLADASSVVMSSCAAPSRHADNATLAFARTLTLPASGVGDEEGGTTVVRSMPSPLRSSVD